MSLQQKIDLVQQVVTFLESTLATGKSTHEQKITNLQTAVANLQKAINDLNGQKDAADNEFGVFSAALGGEINKFCALENILRTVEESQTEKDVKILIPDVSRMDTFVSNNNNTETEWLRLKSEIVRLNAESEEVAPAVGKVMLKVTLKNQFPGLNETQCEQVNRLALAFHTSRGKAIKRLYELPSVTYTEKYVTLSWNKQNKVACSSVNSHMLQIVKDIYKDEGEVVKVELVEKQSAQSIDPTGMILYRILDKDTVIQSNEGVQQAQPSAHSAQRKRSADRAVANKIKQLLAVTLTLRKPEGTSHSTMSVMEVKGGSRERGDDVAVSKEIAQVDTNDAIREDIPTVDTNGDIGEDVHIAATELELGEFEGLNVNPMLAEGLRCTGLALEEWQRELLREVLKGRDVVCRADELDDVVVIGALGRVDFKKKHVQVCIATRSTERSIHLLRRLEQVYPLSSGSTDELMSVCPHEILSNAVLVGTASSLANILQRLKNPEGIRSLFLDEVDLTSITVLRLIYLLDASTQIVITCKTTNNLSGFLTKLRDPYRLIRESNCAPEPGPSTSSRIPIHRHSLSTDSSEAEVPSDTESEHSIESTTLSERLQYDSSEEIDILVEATEVLAKDPTIHTVIPKYVLTQLGLYPTQSTHFYYTLTDDLLKLETLSLLDIEDEKVIVFCNSIESVTSLSSSLRRRGGLPMELHGNLTKKEYSPILQNFAQGTVRRLIVATDFLTEITTQSATLVINYEWNSRSYISRVAFAERCKTPALEKSPMVVSFMNKENLGDLVDQKDRYGIEMLPME